MLSLAFALFVTAAISFAFKTTRAIGILCIALFTFVFPWITAAVLTAALGVFLFFRPK